MKNIMTNTPLLAIQFASKEQAVEACKVIHWATKCAIEVAGYKFWAISDDGRRLLTRSGYSYLADKVAKPEERT
jgi:hypothetical protein